MKLEGAVLLDRNSCICNSKEANKRSYGLKKLSQKKGDLSQEIIENSIFAIGAADNLRLIN